jgi:hypothetical protein
MSRNGSSVVRAWGACHLAAGPTHFASIAMRFQRCTLAHARACTHTCVPRAFVPLRCSRACAVFRLELLWSFGVFSVCVTACRHLPAIPRSGICTGPQSRRRAGGPCGLQQCVRRVRGVPAHPGLHVRSQGTQDSPPSDLHQVHSLILRAVPSALRLVGHVYLWCACSVCVSVCVCVCSLWCDANEPCLWQ